MMMLMRKTVTPSNRIGKLTDREKAENWLRDSRNDQFVRSQRDVKISGS